MFMQTMNECIPQKSIGCKAVNPNSWPAQTDKEKTNKCLKSVGNSQSGLISIYFKKKQT